MDVRRLRRRPHFLNATAGVDGSGNLICAFKEAGLGGTVSTTKHHLFG